MWRSNKLKVNRINDFFLSIKGKAYSSSLVKSFIGVSALSLLAIPLGLMLSIIIARALGPEGFGQYAFITSFVGLLAIPISGGVPQLLTREVARFSYTEEWGLYRGLIKRSYQWVGSFSIVVVGTYYILGSVLHVIPQQGKWQYLPIAIVLLPLMGLTAIRAGSLRGLGQVVYSQVFGLILQPLTVLFLVGGFCVVGQLNVTDVLASQIIAAIVVFIAATILLKKLEPIKSFKIIADNRTKEWAIALTPFTLLALISTLNTQIGILILGLLGTDESVAAMRVAERGAQFVVLSLGVVNTVISPQIVRAYHDRNKDRLQSLSRRSAQLSFVVALPIALIMMFLGRPIIDILFGAEYSLIAVVPLAILSVGQLFNVFFGSVGQILSMSGYENDTLLGHVLALIINVVACVILIPKYGAVGAALGASIGLVTWNIILSFRVVSRLGIRPGAL